VEIYLVGGAVRDALLGRPVRDRDFVVVNATPQTMLEQGYVAVGKDFPVFLHPITREEYALARRERQICDAQATLLTDLAWRDLTINAIAQHTETQALVDPFNGQADLQARVLRHVPGFAADPLRVLRTARLASQLDFAIAPATQTLMADLCAQGALATVNADRIWAELVKGLTGPAPGRFVRELHTCGALAVILPEVEALYGIPQHAQWHPEVDTGVHVEMVVGMAARLAPGNLAVAWAALMHDLGKALTKPIEWPKHHNHELLGREPLKAVHARLPVPNDCQRLADRVCVYHLQSHTSFESRPGTLIKLFHAVDAFRRPDTLRDFTLACEADSRGRLGLTERPYPQAAYLQAMFEVARQVDSAPFVEQGLTGPKLGRALNDARIRAVKHAMGPCKATLGLPSHQAVSPPKTPVMGETAAPSKPTGRRGPQP
jgi:tRNA nucleotidyltransferase (CCA-adding enzyme)